jgi:hypothetical protein
MRSVTYSNIVGPDGHFDWTAPDEEVFRFVTDGIREVGVHLLGRRLYETMLYWEIADQDPSLDDSMLEWAAIWKPLGRRCGACPELAGRFEQRAAQVLQEPQSV